MLDYWESAHKKINKKAEEIGVAALARMTKVNRKTIDAWCAGAYPGIDALGDIAKALDCQPWELLRPEGAQPTLAPLPFSA